MRSFVVGALIALAIVIPALTIGSAGADTKPLPWTFTEVHEVRFVRPSGDLFRKCFEPATGSVTAYWNYQTGQWYKVVIEGKTYRVSPNPDKYLFQVDGEDCEI